MNTAAFYVHKLEGHEELYSVTFYVLPLFFLVQVGCDLSGHNIFFTLYFVANAYYNHLH